MCLYMLQVKLARMSRLGSPDFIMASVRRNQYSNSLYSLTHIEHESGVSKASMQISYNDVVIFTQYFSK